MGVTAALISGHLSKLDNFEKAGGGFVLLVQPVANFPVFPIHILGRICPLISYPAWYIFCLVWVILHLSNTSCRQSIGDAIPKKQEHHTSSTCYTSFQ